MTSIEAAILHSRSDISNNHYHNLILCDEVLIGSHEDLQHEHQLMQCSYDAKQCNVHSNEGDILLLKL